MKKSGLHKQISSIFDGTASEDQACRVNPPTEDQPTPAAPSQSKKSASKAEDQAPAKRPQSHPIPPETTDGLRPKPITRHRLKPARNTKLKISPRADIGKMNSADTKQRKQLLVIAFLGSVLVGVLYLTVFSPAVAPVKGGKTKPTLQTEVAVSAINQCPEELDWQKPNTIILDDARDPMRMARKPKTRKGSQFTQLDDEQALDIVVRGIVYSKHFPTALIAGAIVGEGEVIEGVKIIRINRQTVEFQKDQKRWTQPVQNE